VPIVRFQFSFYGLESETNYWVASLRRVAIDLSRFGGEQSFRLSRYSIPTWSWWTFIMRTILTRILPRLLLLL
jgi:hypothetical protein